jgi:acetyl esterase/lipase
MVTVIAGCRDASGRAGAPAPACGDTQPGRYVRAQFEPAEVVAVGIGGGRMADVHQPADDHARCRPAIVWVHGGGFTTGARNGPAEEAWGDALARLGYVWMSIDYDLGDGPQFGLADATSGARADVVDRAIEQADAAVAWLRSRAADLGVDPDRMALGGTSAGAMTALGAGLVEGDAASSVCTIIAVAGDARPAWLGPGATSVLLVHGDADDVVPFAAAEQAAAALEAAGRRTRLVPISGAGHEIVGPPPEAVMGAVSAWLAENLAPGCG